MLDHEPVEQPIDDEPQHRAGVKRPRHEDTEDEGMFISEAMECLSESHEPDNPE